jgi:hypothetical protein
VKELIDSLTIDTQSGFHQWEANVMVDSPELMPRNLALTSVNQNARLYEHVLYKDGIWRCEDGEVVQANGVGASSFIKGLKGLQGREGSQDRWFLEVSLIYRSM